MDGPSRNLSVDPRWQWVGMTATLVLILLAAVHLNQRSLGSQALDCRLDCSGYLVEVAEALEAYKAAHEGLFYPTYLEQLVPDYLSQVPSCVASQSRGWGPDYQVSCDRKWYALACTANHNGFGPAHPTAAVTPRYLHPSLQPRCLELLREEARHVQESLERGELPRTQPDGRFPASSSSASEPERGPSCAGDHALCPRADGSFEIVCTSYRHLAVDGLRPLEPRYDSRRDVFTSRPLRRFQGEPLLQWGWSFLTAAMVVGVSTFMLWIRRRRLERIRFESVDRMALDF